MKENQFSHFCRYSKFQGDCGDGSTKIGLSIGNSPNPQSPHNITLMGLANSGDERSSLELVFAPLLRELETLHGYRFSTLDSSGDIVNCVIHTEVIGDGKFLVSLLGQSGPNSSHFCPMCECPKIGKITEWQPFLKFPMRKAGVKGPGVVRNALLNVDGEQVVPAGLHMILNLFNKIMEAFKRLILFEFTGEASILIDFDDLQDEMDSLVTTSQLH